MVIEEPTYPYPLGGIEVFEREEAVGASRPLISSPSL